MQPADRELTLRALVVGCALGAILATANVYMGLKTGWGDTGNVTSAILGFSLFALLRGRGGYTRLENNITQTVASAAAGMPFTAGVISGFPALTLLRHNPPGWAIALIGFAVAIVGSLIALALRAPLIEHEQLPFPSGIATAELIDAMHSPADTKQSSRARSLVLCAVIAAAVVWLRDGRPAWLPALSCVPLSFAAVSACTLMLGVSWSPMLLGAGALVGLRNAVSLAIGALVAWAVVAPRLAQRHLVDVGAYDAFAGWLMWPGVALMLGAATTALVVDRRVLWRGLRDLPQLWRANAAHPAGGSRLALAIVVVIASVVAAAWAMHVSLVAVALALVVSLLLSTVCARATGETDIAPVTQVGQLTQVGFGVPFPGAVATNIVAATVASGAASQTALLSWAFKTGHALGANPRKQLQAQLVGAAIGAVVVVPTYRLLEHAWGVGSKMLPAPAAVVWKSIGELQLRGAGALPAAAAVVVAVAAVVGVALTIAEKTRARRWLPTPFAFGVGFVVPASYASAILLGAVGLALAERAWPATAKRHGHAVAAGAIVGESAMGIVIAALIAAKLIAR